MERKEPTLSGANNNEREEPIRRPSPSPRERAPDYVQEHGSGAGPLPAIALVVALLGVAGAGFLGWKLTEAQAALMKADGRISQLENQLNVTSTESTATVGSLQVKLIAVDGEVKKLWEVSRKATATLADTTEKFNGVNKAIDSNKREVAEVKNDAHSLKQDALAQKAGLDEVTARLEAQEKALVEQKKRVQDVAASVTAALNQVKSAEGLAARITTAEEAIDAIDDNRRTINRDLAQIKQTMGLK